MRRIWWGTEAVVLALVAVGFVAPAVVRAQLAAALSEQAGQPVPGGCGAHRLDERLVGRSRVARWG